MPLGLILATPMSTVCGKLIIPVSETSMMPKATPTSLLAGHQWCWIPLMVVKLQSRQDNHAQEAKGNLPDHLYQFDILSIRHRADYA